MGPSPDTNGAKRRSSTAIGLAVAGLALTGCAASFNAQSQQQYQPAAGVSDRSGDVYAIDSLVVTDGRGDGTLVSALINQQARADKLISVTAATLKGSQLQVAAPSGGVPLAPGRAVQLGYSGAVRVNGASLEAGSIITLTFTFAQAAPLQVQVPVVTDTTTYKRVPVGPTSGPY